MAYAEDVKAAAARVQELKAQLAAQTATLVEAQEKAHVVVKKEKDALDAVQAEYANALGKLQPLRDKVEAARSAYADACEKHGIKAVGAGSFGGTKVARATTRYEWNITNDDKNLSISIKGRADSNMSFPTAEALEHSSKTAHTYTKTMAVDATSGQTAGLANRIKALRDNSDKPAKEARVPKAVKAPK